MSLGHRFPFHKAVALDRWVDKFTTRFELELTAAWPDLAEQLRKHVRAMTWREIATGPGEAFREKCVKPTVNFWEERHVKPIIEVAGKQFPGPSGPEFSQVACDADAPANGVLRPRDILEGTALPGGLLLGAGAVGAGLTTATTLLVITTMVVNWPLLIGGLIAGMALSIFGGVRLALLKESLFQRFEIKLLPEIREAIIGEGVGRDGHTVPSLKQQLQQQVCESAALAKKLLNATG
jgi:hypothetical protein